MTTYSAHPWKEEKDFQDFSHKRSERKERNIIFAPMNTNNEIETRQRAIVRLTLIGTVINALLLVLKFFAGIVASSSAMIADAVHSLSDFLTDFVVVIMLRISSKPSDKDHKYGHGKYETLATSIIGLFLIVVGSGIVFSGVSKIIDFAQGEAIPQPGMLALGAAIVSIVFKEGIFHYTLYKGKNLSSQALIANAWHHRSDALSSIGTALGIGMAILLGNRWAILDPIASIVVSFFIFKVACKLIKDSVNELLECSLPPETEERIIALVNATDGVTDLHHLRTRQIGNNYAISMHIRLNGKITLNEAHRKSIVIEKTLKKEFGANTYIEIHIEPCKNEHGEYDKD